MAELTFFQVKFAKCLTSSLVLSRSKPLLVTCVLWCWWGSIMVLAGGPYLLCRPESHWMGFSTGWQEEEEVARTVLGRVSSWITFFSCVCVCVYAHMFRPAAWLQFSFTHLQCCFHSWWCYWLSGGSCAFFVFVSLLSLHSRAKTGGYFSAPALF